MGRITLQTGFRWLQDSTEKSRAATFAKFMNGPTIAEVQSASSPPEVGIEIDFAGLGGAKKGFDTGLARAAGTPNKKRYYLWGGFGAPAVTNAGLTADQLLAQPWRAPLNFIADRFVFKTNQNLNSSNFKVAIDEQTSETNSYPLTRIAESGQLASGAEAITGHYVWEPGDITFENGKVYWFSFLCQTSTGAVFYGISNANFGYEGGFSMDTAYNALLGLNAIASTAGIFPYANGIPDPFPAEADLGLAWGTYQLFMVGVHVKTLL